MGNFLTNFYNDISENKEIIQDTSPNKFLYYPTDELSNSNQKTTIFTTDKKYKIIEILCFTAKKDEAKKLIKKNDIISIQKAMEYDNTSHEIILKNNKINPNDKLMGIFDINKSKNDFKKLIKQILSSNEWKK